MPVRLMPDRLASPIMDHETFRVGRFLVEAKGPAQE